MKRIGFISALFAMALTAFAQNYTVNCKLPEDLDGAMAYIYVSMGPDIDSALVVDRQCTFTGHVPKPLAVKLQLERTVIGFYLENDTIDITVTRDSIPGGIRTDWDIKGGELNGAYRRMNDSLMAISKVYSEDLPKEERARLSSEFESVITNTMRANADNALGAALAMQTKQPKEYFDAHPAIKDSETVKAYIKRLEAAKKTQAGQMFSDFTVKHGGEVHHLSDAVGKGDYVLLDFWASWCGPCIASMGHLKEIHEKYSDKNFKILGVTINDSPENSLAAVSRHSLPWEIWVNDNSDYAISTYMVETIPHTILFAPDGTILLNKPSDEELDTALSEIFNTVK